MLKKTLADIARIALSAVLISVAVKDFFHTYNLAPGGTTGLAIILSYVTGVPVQYITLGVSVPLLLLAVFFLGKSFGAKTLLSVLLTPAVMGLIPYVDISRSILLSAVLGGLCVGGGIGLCFRSQAATGGTDTISLLLHRVFPRIPLRVIMFGVDGIIILFSGLITRDIKVSVFSLISLLVIVPTVNWVGGQKEEQKKNAENFV